jgi:hypothetical protein
MSSASTAASPVVRSALTAYSGGKGSKGCCDACGLRAIVGNHHGTVVPDSGKSTLYKGAMRFLNFTQAVLDRRISHRSRGIFRVAVYRSNSALVGLGAGKERYRRKQFRGTLVELGIGGDEGNVKLVGTGQVKAILKGMPQPAGKLYRLGK